MSPLVIGAVTFLLVFALFFGNWIGYQSGTKTLGEVFQRGYELGKEQGRREALAHSYREPHTMTFRGVPETRTRRSNGDQAAQGLTTR